MDSTTFWIGGVVDDDVDPAPFGYRRLDHPRRVGRNGDVALDPIAAPPASRIARQLARPPRR